MKKKSVRDIINKNTDNEENEETVNVEGSEKEQELVHMESGESNQVEAEEVQEQKKKMSKKKKLIIGCSCLVLVVLLLVTAANCYLNSVLGKVNRMTDDEIRANAVIDEEEESTATETPQKDIDSINANMNAFSGLDGLMDGDDVYNIMLLGSDTRKEDSIGLTDVMILVSINKDTKKIFLTSFMRDSYVEIPGYSNNRLNSAFCKGFDVFSDTMAENYGLKIDRYVYINFFDFIDAIDTLGGIDVEITEKEMTQINKLFAEINKYLGDPTDDGKLTSYGKIHLTGKQTLAYARVRKQLDGSDFSRTERQRVVLEQVMEQLKSKSLLEINDLANEILPMVTTNLETSEIKTLLMNSLTYMGYDLEQQRIPIDHSWSNIQIAGADMLDIDFAENSSYLAQTIYNQGSETAESTDDAGEEKESATASDDAN